MTEIRNNKVDSPDMTPTLVAKLREGNAEAGQILDQMFRARLTRFCLGYLSNREAAEDVVQDVFFRVLRSTTVPDNFRAWVYEISRNRCLDRLRSRKRRIDDRTLPTFSHIAVHIAGNLTKLVKSEQQEHLWQHLIELPSGQREVLLLRYAEGLSRAEIAKVLGIPEKLVKHRIYNGLLKLRKHGSIVTKR